MKFLGSNEKTALSVYVITFSFFLPARARQKLAVWLLLKF